MKEIEDAVHEVHANLFQSGGIIAQCEFGAGADPINVRTVFETWDSLSGELV